MKLVLSLGDIGIDDRELVGGKGYALAVMASNGFRVPVSLCITSECYHR
jgi:phosphoenolpyruvate synthase/pyruvate phosphate dikinase